MSGKFHLGEPNQAQPHRPRNMSAGERHDGWHACCASSIWHRFDCRSAGERALRGRGPFLPVGTPSAADLVAPLRNTNT